jgi:hypothetical protein
MFLAPDLAPGLTSMPDTSAGQPPTQQPARWTYDLDPATGDSRASYAGTLSAPSLPGGGFLPLSGGTISGNLTISTATPTLILNKQASGQTNLIVGWLNTLNRWRLHLGDATPETGGNSGSGFAIGRFSDAGASIDSPLVISRSTGGVTLSAPLTAPGVVDASNAAAGTIGEVISQVNSAGTSAPTLSQINIAQITLPAGDWDVSGEAWFNTMTVTFAGVGIGLVSATVPAAVTLGSAFSAFQANTVTPGPVLSVGPARISLAAPTNVYLTGQQNGGTGNITGKIFARRRR